MLPRERPVLALKILSKAHEEARMESHTPKRLFLPGRCTYVGLAGWTGAELAPQLSPTRRRPTARSRGVFGKY